ncbi:hypothetical protein SAMN04515621_1781 [Erythrobacter sp. HL-111]|nr:MAG: HPr Serine kinase C-terminal domain [Erythrobacteraceae bacterium HL-111]SDS55505.1 hypothetical protein SAMN04515621_1781 [Erythrobacter sp. HL-111]
MNPDALRAGLLPAWSLRHLGAGSPPGLAPTPPEESPARTLPSSVQRLGESFCLSFAGLARFLIDLAKQEITVFDVAAEATPSDLEHFLHDHVVPRILAEQGSVVLHGSAVAIGGRLAIFLGNTGAGKSTLAASLHEAGHPLLGDDAVVVAPGEGRFHGRAVYPTLRLFPDTISQVFGGAVETSPMAHYSDKLRVSVPAIARDAARSFPLGALFFLTGEGGASDPRADETSPSAACMALVEQSFALDPGDPGKAAARLREIARLAGAIPGYRLTYPHDYGRIAELHGVIFAAMAQSDTGNPARKRAMTD